MREQSTAHITEKAKKGHSRRLRGIWLWLARGIYIATLMLIVTFFAIGFPAYLASWNQGGIGATVSQSTEEGLIISVSPVGDAAGAGVQNGDILTAVNGVPVTLADQANQLLTGKIGEPVTITVRTGHQVARQYTLVYAGTFLQLLGQLHLSLQFLVIYNTAFNCLLALGVILSSPLVFFRRTNDWLVILIAFSMLAFASILLNPVTSGACTAPDIPEQFDLQPRHGRHLCRLFCLSYRSFRATLDPLGGHSYRRAGCAGFSEHADV